MSMSPTIDRESPLPLYAQIKRSLQAKLMSWPAENDRFYTDHELQRIFGVSRATVRQALTELEVEGLVRRRRGFGTFVNRDKIEESFAARSDFSGQWAQSGRSLRVANLKVERTSCPAHFAKALGLPPGTEVLSMERLRLSAELRVAWDLRYIPLAIAGEIALKEFENVSLLQVLRHQVVIERADTQIEAALADEEYAERLNIHPAAPVLVREMTYFAAGGAPAFTGISVYRADQVRYKFSGPLETDGDIGRSDVRVKVVQRAKA